MTVSNTDHSPTPRCLIVVPAYNEAASISHVVEDLRKHVPDFDVLVIDDGSSDATAARVPDGAVVIRLPFNLGIGGAMQAGFRYAHAHGYDVAIQVDADGQHPSDQVASLVHRLGAGDADMVIGSRFLEPGGYAQSPSRMAGIRLLRTLLRLLTGKTFTDCTSGFRAVNSKVIGAFAHWYPDDYPEPEVVLLLDRAGYRIAEVPVQMRHRTAGQTSIPFLWGLFYVTKVAAALLLDMIRQPWPDDKVNLP